MRSAARFGSTVGGALGAAASLLLLRCTGTAIQAMGTPGWVQVDPAEVRLQPTWEIHPTRLPTPIA